MTYLQGQYVGGREIFFKKFTSKVGFQPVDFDQYLNLPQIDRLSSAIRSNSIYKGDKIIFYHKKYLHQTGTQIFLFKHQQKIPKIKIMNFLRFSPVEKGHNMGTSQNLQGRAPG